MTRTRQPEPPTPVTALEAMARRYARRVFVGETDRPPHPAPAQEQREVPR